MKRFILVSMLLIIAITATAQSIKRTIYPIYAEMTNDTTAVETPELYVIVEDKKVGKANGGDVRITIERNNEVLRSIHSASHDTRFIKGYGYAALKTSNFILIELRNKKGNWYMDQRTRNKDGRTAPTFDVYY